MKTIYDFEEVTKYQIKEYRTPKEMTELYEHGESCMSICRSSAFNSQMLKDTGIWKTAMFSFIPRVSGLALLKNGEVIARTLVQGKVQFGGIYTELVEYDEVDEEAVVKFEDTLRKLRYRRGELKISRAGFKIPGFKYKNKHYMPVAYVYNGLRDIDVFFNKNTKEFTVKPGMQFHVNDTALDIGWICEDEAHD